MVTVAAGVSVPFFLHPERAADMATVISAHAYILLVFFMRVL